MTRGVLIPAVTTEHQAAASLLANSIRIKNPKLKIALVLDSKKNLLKRYNRDFDEILEFPYGNLHDVRANDWQLYWATSFDSNLVIDPLSIVCQDLESIFDYLEYSYHVAFPTTRRRFNGSKITISDQFYTDTGVTELNTGVWFFKKSEPALVYFQFADILMQNWRSMQTSLIDNKIYHRTQYDSNYVTSLAVHYSRQPELYVCRDELFNTIDMSYETYILKKHNMVEESWIEKLNYWTTNGELKIQNHNINSIVNYIDFNFQTEEMHEQYRNRKTVMGKVSS